MNPQSPTYYIFVSGIFGIVWSEDKKCSKNIDVKIAEIVMCSGTRYKARGDVNSWQFLTNFYSWLWAFTARHTSHVDFLDTSSQKY